MSRRRGPYKLFLEPGTSDKLSSHTKRRRAEVFNQLLIDVFDDNTAHPRNEQFGNLEIESDDAVRVLPTTPPHSPQDDESFLIDEPPSPDQFQYGDGARDEVLNDEVDDSLIVTDKSENDSEDIISHSFESLLDYLKLHERVNNFVVDFNVGEILLMVLTLSLIHNLSLQCMCDIMKLLNVLFCTSVFPSTKYLFKKYLNPSRNMMVHYICENCSEYLGCQGDDVDLDGNNDGSFICDNCKKNNIIKGYRYDFSFMTLDISDQILDILKDPKCKLNFDTAMNENIFSDITSGLMYKRKVPNSQGLSTKYITFTFNVDGSPISKDAKTSITPIFLMINELDYSVRSKNLILAGLWYGKEKPRIDIFLNQFVKQINDLNEKGITIKQNGKTAFLKVIPLCCCVDSIARAQVQGIKSVNGYYCCSWCQVKGKNIQATNIKYPCENPEPNVRTERNFQKSCDMLVKGETDIDFLRGVNNVSPLLELNFFSIIWGFCPDVMHLVFIGISFRFMEIWLSDTNFEGYIGTPTIIKSIDNVISKLQVPKYLKRIPVKLTLRRVMKSRELENWFLFYSIPCLKGHLPRKFYRHWMLLVQAVRTLLQDEVSRQDIDEAEKILYEFVYKTEQYYGPYEMTYNMHQLLHLAESVRRWGPLWAHTAYPFESSIGNVKSVLKATTGVPHQIFRNIELNQACNVIMNNSRIGDTAFNMCEKIHTHRAKKLIKSNCKGTFLGSSLSFSENIIGLPDNIKFISFNRFIKNGILFHNKTAINADRGDKKTDNSYVELKDGSYGQIIWILCTDNEIKEAYFVLENLVCEDLDILKHTKLIRGRGQIITCKESDIKCVAVHVNIDEYNEYITSIPMKHYAMNL